MKYKVLIIEDEPGIRKRLVKLIDWEAMNCEICGQADSGITGLERIINQQPDVVISDIVMPGIDGLMLLQYVKEHYAATRFIIMSAYQEFSYVKQAMELGAFKFLTKPINPDELKKAVSDLVLQFNEEKYQRLNRLREPSRKETSQDLLKPALQGKELDDYSFSQLSRLLPARYQLVNFQLDVEDVLARDSYFPLFSNSVTEKLQERGAGLLCPLDNTSVVVIFDSKQGEGLSPKRLAKKICAGLEGFRFPYSVGISGDGEGVSSLIEKFQESQQALKKSFYEPELILHQYRRVEKGEPDLNSLAVLLQVVPEHLEDLTEELFIQLGKTEEPGEAKVLAMNIFCLLAAQALGSGQKHLKCASKNRKELSRFLAAESLEQLRSVFEELCGTLYMVKPTRGGTDRGKIVRQVMDYIAAHYGKEITVGTAADQVYLSPSYLSALLKSYTGQSFTDLLVAYRMDQAQDYLSAGRRISEVSQLVGYKNAQYFSTAFKNSVGMTPSEYRNLKGDQPK